MDDLRTMVTERVWFRWVAGLFVVVAFATATACDNVGDRGVQDPGTNGGPQGPLDADQGEDDASPAVPGAPGAPSGAGAGAGGGAPQGAALPVTPEGDTQEDVNRGTLIITRLQQNFSDEPWYEQISELKVSGETAELRLEGADGEQAQVYAQQLCNAVAAYAFSEEAGVEVKEVVVRGEGDDELSSARGETPADAQQCLNGGG
jgi:hypothetical protein